MSQSSQCMMLKLVSGETIISYVIENEQEVLLNKPYMPIIIQKSVDDIEIVFKRWVSLTTNNVFTINKNNVICMLKPDKDIEDMYKKTLDEVEKIEKEAMEQIIDQVEKEIIEESTENNFFENSELLEDESMIFENSDELNRKVKNEEEREKKKIPKWRKKSRWKM